MWVTGIKGRHLFRTRGRGCAARRGGPCAYPKSRKLRLRSANCSCASCRAAVQKLRLDLGHSKERPVAARSFSFFFFCAAPCVNLPLASTNASKRGKAVDTGRRIRKRGCDESVTARFRSDTSLAKVVRAYRRCCGLVTTYKRIIAVNA